MEQITKGPIQPLRLGPDSRFQFRCHKDVKCFTQCCRGINIILTPYDIIGLKSRLGLSSEEFLAVYTELQMLEKTDVPVVTLKLLDEEGAPADRKACPFVRPEGLLACTLMLRDCAVPAPHWPKQDMSDDKTTPLESKEYRILKAMKLVLTDVVKDTATQPGLSPASTPSASKYTRRTSSG